MGVKRNDIVIRQADGPDVLHELMRGIQHLMPTAKDSAGDYLKGKGQQQIAKAQEIYANITEKIGQLEIERQRLIKERDESTRKAQIEERQNKRNATLKKESRQKTHEERMYESRTERLKAITEHLKVCTDNGIKIDMQIISQALYDIFDDSSQT